MPPIVALFAVLSCAVSAEAQIAFTERALQAGVADGGAANGAVFGDYNEDGWPDLFVARLEVGASSLLYANAGNGTFADESALVEGVGRSMGGVFVDYDGDGDRDLYAVRFNESNALLRNERGALVLLPEDELAAGHPGATSAVFADFDGDGQLDLYSTHRYVSANQYFPSFSTSGFVERTHEQSGLRSGRETFAAVAFDYDGDGDQDLYVANFGFADLLHRNDGRGAFTQVAESAGLGGSDFSVAGLPADYDGDGDFDLYVLHANERENALWENVGDGRFERHLSAAEGRSSSAGGVAADFDLDGDIDILVSNLGKVEIYANGGDGHFDDVSSTAVPLPLRADSFTAGVAVADYDLDGDVDVFLCGMRGADALLRNERSAGHWLAFEWPPGSEGARVQVRQDDSRQVRQQRVDTQLGSAAAGAHFGLRTDAAVDVEIDWPSGQRQVLDAVAVDQVVPLVRPVAERDVAIAAVHAPTGAQRWDTLRPEVDVANLGAQRAQGVVLRGYISADGRVLYDERVRVLGLDSGQRARVELPPFSPQRSGQYRIEFSLEGDDEVPQNDRWQRSLYWHPFVDVAADMGVTDPEGAGWAAAMADGDGDGDVDLYISNGGSFGAGENVYYRNDGDRFTDVTRENGTADSGNGTGVVFADFNGDGHQDIFMAKGGFLPPGEADRLLYNSGDGTFVDRSQEAGLDAVQASYAAAVGDYDGDGALDLYVSMFRGQSNRLYRNGGDVFIDESRSRRIVSYQRFTGSAAAFADFDMDGDMDLYASMYGIYDAFYAEVGDSSYATAEVGDEGDAVGLAMGDYDGDGDLDLFVANQSWRSGLWRNDLSTRTFVDVASQSGVENQGPGTGCAFGDYDNDGDLDLFVVNGHDADRVYMNRGDGTFIDVAMALGMADTVRARAVLLSDYDGDGDLDPYVVNERRPNRLYRNDGSGAHWLQVRARGVQSNRDAVGTRLSLYANGRALHRQVNGTAGMGHSSRVVSFGLGGDTRVDSLVLHWPSGRVQRLVDLPINRRIEVVEGQRATSVRDREESLPQTMQLLANYPNPFNAETRIGFEVAKRGPVQLVVYNALGQRVRSLLAQEISAGRYELKWDGRDDGGMHMASGVYYYRLHAQESTRSRALLLLR